MGEIDFVEEPFEVTISNGNAILEWPQGVRRAVPLNVFRMEHVRAGRALAEYDARRAEIVPFKKSRRAGH